MSETRTETGYYDEEPSKGDWARTSPRRSRSRSPRSRSTERKDDSRGRRSSERDRDGRRHTSSQARDRGSRDRGSRSSGSDRRGRNFASRECRVYVTNIPYELKWMELKDIMRKVGDVQYVEMITDNQGKPRGIAVVEFTREDDAAQAIKELDDYEILGRKLKVREDRVDDDKYQVQLKQHKEFDKARKQGQGQGQVGMLGSGGNMSFLNTKSADPVNSTVFISNLDYKTTWQKVKDMFRRAGNVIRVDIAEDQDKKSKGFGTVVFETPGEALSAVSMFNGFMFGDRSLVARLDRDSSLSRMMGPTGGGGGGSGHNSQQGQNSFESQNQMNQQTSQATNPLALLQLQSLAALSALASGAFGGLGGGGTGLSGSGASSLGLGGQGGLDSLGNSGLGALSGLGGLSSLLGLGGGNLGGALGQGQGQAFGGGLSANSGGMRGGLGNSPNSLSKMGSGGGRDDSGRQIFVRNLPWKVTWQDLKDRFRNCGRVIRADIMTDDRGRSRGCGTVLFETQDEAHIAVSLMNGTKVDGRDMEVKIDRK